MSPGGARDRKDREGDSQLVHDCERCGHPETEHDSVTGRCGHVNRSSTSITVCMCAAYVAGANRSFMKKSNEDLRIGHATPRLHTTFLTVLSKQSNSHRCVDDSSLSNSSSFFPSTSFSST